MTWTAEQERQFLEMQAQREESYQLRAAGLSMLLDELGLCNEFGKLAANADRIIKALEPFAALKEQK